MLNPKDLMMKWRNEGYHLNYGRDVLVEFLDYYNGDSCRLLDIGCGEGGDLMNFKEHLEDRGTKMEPYGLEVDPVKVAGCRKAGIKMDSIDLESSPLPFKDAFFDVTVCNQAYEHLKNWMWIFHEQIRVTRKEGLALIGVPNLAAWHCRVQLMLGVQPSCIKIDDCHVRGFTPSSIRNLIESIEGLSLIEFGGSNFYGVPPFIASKVGRMLPELATSIFFLVRKTNDSVPVIDKISAKTLETNFFTG